MSYILQLPAIGARVLFLYFIDNYSSMSGRPLNTTSINAKDIQTYYAETLPNLIYSKGQKADLETLTKSANMRSRMEDTVIQNNWMKGNKVNGTNSTLAQKNSQCEAVGNGDAFDHLSSLASSEDTQSRVRCGWVYNNSNPYRGRGAYGVSDGPLTTSASGTWIWNLNKAKQRMHTDICKGIRNCTDINASMYKNRCGWCKSSGQGVPVVKNGLAYPNNSNTMCPTNKLIMNASTCPAPNEADIDLLEGFAPLISGDACDNDKNGSLSRDCLLQKVLTAGCSDEGSLYRALREGSDNNYTSSLLNRPAWSIYQRNATIPLNQSGLRSGKMTASIALDEFTKVQDNAASPANGGLQYAARDLCFRQGALDEYDFCNDIHDTQPGPFLLECLQKAFLKAGGQKLGAAYPTVSTMNMWNSIDTWGKVKQRMSMMQQNTLSNDYTIKSPAVKNFYGITI